MNRLLQQLKISGSTLALVSAASFITSQAIAQSAPPPADDIETVTVTGTSIKGAAPVGSNVMAVSTKDMENMGISDVTEALADVPSIMFFGSAGRAVTTSSNGQPGISVGIHQIGGMSSASTLVLIDGHRAVQSGLTNYFVNPDQIPENMLERVEVLADGSSAVYGSDAVAGVVNFITRKSFDGIELGGQETFITGETNYKLDALVGNSWSGGSFVFGATYSHDGQLKDVSRPWTSPLAQTARAALAGVTGPNPTNFGDFNCNPATLQPGGSGNIFTSPTSGVSVANTPANQPCQQWSEAALFPDEERQNAMIRVTQNFGSHFTFSGDAMLFHRTNQQIVSAGTLTATAFSTGPQANPFYVRPTGYTGTATSETVRWDANGLLPSGLSNGEDDTVSADVSLDYNIDDNWDVNFALTAGRDDLAIDTRGTLNGTAALLALNGTGQTNGNPTATDIPGYNNITTNFPLTTSNALDVWNPAGATNGTSAATIRQLTNSLGTQHGYFGLLNYKLSGSGTVFNTWAGPVKTAFGIEVNNYAERQIGTNAGGAAPTSVDSQLYDYDFGRGDTAEYVEADVPLVSPEMAIPFVQKLEMDFAGRHDHYSDFGGTNNWKAAFNWDVMDGLRFRANMSTSFVAPVLTLEGGPQGLSNFSTVGLSLGSTIGAIPVQYYPLVTEFGIAGCTTASTTCNISTLMGIKAGIGGGPTLQPAKGRTWSVGVDLDPDFLPGFSSQITYWSDSIGNAVAQPGQAIAVTNLTLVNLLQLYPSCATPAQYTPYASSRSGYPIPQTSAFPSCIQFTNTGVSDNFLYLWVNGIDLQADYKVDTENYGNFTIGATATQLTQFNNAYSYRTPPMQNQVFSTLNTEGINTGYPALAQTMRSHVSWQDMGIQADLYWNFSGPYKNVSSTAATALVNVNNLYSGQGGDHVGANSTFDLHLGYSFDGGMFGDDTVSLVVDNLLDKKPPYYNVSAGYDVSLGSPIGRAVTLGFKSKF